MTYKTALVTGGAIRIGRDICKKLHEMVTTLSVITINQKMKQKI
jgi:short-subunit dehydrogenase involved in D-alanine esterification of teichoic acids